MINGVVVKPLRRIPDERGFVMHMLRADDPEFEKFGEIYFYAIEFYHTVILQKESRKTVYTALRKVVGGPKTLSSKMGSTLDSISW